MFKELFENQNLSSFCPKKNKCDICCGHDTKNVSSEVNANHN